MWKPILRVKMYNRTAAPTIKIFTTQKFLNFGAESALDTFAVY